MDEPVILHGKKLENAISRAKQWAADNNQPLTLERAAVFLESDRETILDLMKSEVFIKQCPADAKRLRGLYAYCNAEIADALVKSGRQSGVLLLAKTNYRYADGESVPGAPIFTGEDELV